MAAIRCADLPFVLIQAVLDKPQTPTIDLKPTWKINKTVLPQHVDHAGVMWHGTYFNWLEEGRINALSKVGIDYSNLNFRRQSCWLGGE